MSKPDGGPAFPNAIDNSGGISVRDYFAARAMQSLVGGNGWVEEMDVIAHRAYKIADEMIRLKKF